jgi:hypothetical protein
MSLIEINLGLRRALLRYPTAELLNSPYSVAAILSLSHDALQAFVRHANAEAGETSEACLSGVERTEDLHRQCSDELHQLINP